MVTETEELQAKEFLKRAEIKTMKKDLQALRESDASKERDKIANIRTLEEQLAASTKALANKEEKESQEREKMKAVLERNEKQERVAEKDLKKYATEEERQQMFLLESQRLGFEDQIKLIDEEKDPALKLEKNKLLIKKRQEEEQLNAVVEKEKKLEEEQKFVAQEALASQIPATKKGLESRRWELEEEIKGIEKDRWAAEKQVQETDKKIAEVDNTSEKLIVEKNNLRDKVLGIDKSLREIYSVVMEREEEKRRGSGKEQLAQKEALEKFRREENEKVQRQQWTGAAPMAPRKHAIEMPTPPQKTGRFDGEEEQRKKFLQEVSQMEQTEKNINKQINNG